MSDQSEEPKKKPLSLGGGSLSLTKTVDGGKIRQSFAQGRTKTVTVEVKRTVKVAGKTTTVTAPVAEIPQASDAAVGGKLPDNKANSNLPTLTAQEREARLRALQTAASAGEDQSSVRKKLEQEYVRRTAEIEKQRVEEIEAQKRREEEDARKKTEAEAKKKADAQVKKMEAPAPRPVNPDLAQIGRRVTYGERAAPVVDNTADEREAPAKSGPGKLTLGKAAKKLPGGFKDGGDGMRTGKLTARDIMAEEEEGVRSRSLAAMRRAREKQKRQGMSEETVKQVREVVVPETITVQDLANRMAERGADVIKSLMKLGVMASFTQAIDADTAELIVAEFGHKVKRVAESDVELGMRGSEDTDTDLQPRPPVVTIMGHVDHGKTSLLDAIRQTNVVSGEAGGITQHIGAYMVTAPSGQKITFIDTPGHEAFSEMRARGANATDIVVLVVAADDGVMPQTIEALSHAQAAKAPIIVAINKMDKPGANPTRVLTDLLSHNIVTEAMGGETLAVEVSAKNKTNLDKLEEAILLQAEIMKLRANPNRHAEGIVIEAKLEKGRGSVATVLVQRGTLKVGQIFVTGKESGRVRALIDDKGKNVVAATPGMPVEVVGLNGTPLAGDDFVVVENDKRAAEITEYRQRQAKVKQNVAGRGSLQDMFAKIKSGEIKELGVIVKSDVHGSLEAIKGSLEKLANSEVAVKVLQASVGGITESDVALASATGALVIGFNVRANAQARDIAKRDGIDIRYYSIIYEIIDDIKAALTGMLTPELREEIIGNAEIRDVFNITKVGKVAGCYVTTGIVKRGAGVRLLRDNTVIHTGTLKTLKRFKDEVKEVKEGFECGMAFENYDDIKSGDVIECYETKEMKRTLESVA